jgi:hypothetical protein
VELGGPYSGTCVAKERVSIQSQTNVFQGSHHKARASLLTAYMDCAVLKGKKSEREVRSEEIDEDCEVEYWTIFARRLAYSHSLLGPSYP